MLFAKFIVFILYLLDIIIFASIKLSIKLHYYHDAINITRLFYESNCI